MATSGGRGFVSDVACSPSAPREARWLLAPQLAAAGIDLDSAAAQSALVVISELTTNAVAHSSDPLRIEVDLRDGGHLRVSVCDGNGEQHPTPLHPQSGRAAGWGVELVERLADRWGVGERPDGLSGKEVWAELRIDGG